MSERSRELWQYSIEWIICPVTGLSLFVFGALTGTIGIDWIPGILGLIAFPFARQLDRFRRDR